MDLFFKVLFAFALCLKKKYGLHYSCLYFLLQLDTYLMISVAQQSSVAGNKIYLFQSQKVLGLK